MTGFVGRPYGNAVMFLCNMAVRLNSEVTEEVGVRINRISNDKDTGLKARYQQSGPPSMGDLFQ